MNQTTPQQRSLAKDLILHETLENTSSELAAPGAFQVTEGLRRHLSNLMGKGGFRALLVRALALASAEVSWLGAVHVSPDGTLEPSEQQHSQMDAAEFLEGRIVVLAELLGLLEALIGPDLTARQVAEIWPKLRSVTLPAADSEVQNERAK
jgi:hypothetical protein